MLRVLKTKSLFKRLLQPSKTIPWAKRTTPSSKTWTTSPGYRWSRIWRPIRTRESLHNDHSAWRNRLHPLRKLSISSRDYTFLWKLTVRNCEIDRFRGIDKCWGKQPLCLCCCKTITSAQKVPNDTWNWIQGDCECIYFAKGSRGSLLDPDTLLEVCLISVSSAFCE